MLGTFLCWQTIINQPLFYIDKSQLKAIQVLNYGQKNYSNLT